MGLEEQQNLELMGTGAVDWPAFINDLIAKYSAGRTVKLVAGETITERKGFYISDESAGEKAFIYDGSKEPVGIWQSASTATGVEGFGQVSGLIDGSSDWTWTPGAKLYLDTSGVLTETNTGSRVVAVAISAQVILLIPKGAGNPVSDNTYRKMSGRVTYDFAEHGGAISTIGLGVKIPDNAIITRAYYEVITTLSSSSAELATVSIDIPTDDVAGILAAIAISHGSTPWDAGNHDCIQNGAIGNFTAKTTAEREISVTIAVEAVTAGKFILFFDYIMSE